MKKICLDEQIISFVREAEKPEVKIGLPKNCGSSPSLTVCTADRKIYNPTPSTSDNRLSSNDGYSFDNAGNTTRDAQSRKFTYDAENKQAKVETVNSGGTVTGTIGEYYYDGDGKRVKKYVPGTGETTIFVYDASGKMVAEYSTNLSQTPQVSYLTNDHLGSPRINTDQNGAVTARHDYQPFGEEFQRASRRPPDSSARPSRSPIRRAGNARASRMCWAEW